MKIKEVVSKLLLLHNTLIIKDLQKIGHISSTLPLFDRVRGTTGLKRAKLIPDWLHIWQMGVYDLSKVKYGSFGKVDKDKRKLFLKNLKWLKERA